MNVEVKKLYRKKKDIANRKSKSEMVVHILASVILLTVGFSYLFALLWAVMAGTMSHEQLLMDPFKFPEELNLKNYIEAFNMLELETDYGPVNMIAMIGNSLWLVGGGTLLSVAASTMMAYAMTKYDFVGRKFLYGVQIFILTVPIIGSLGSQMRLYTFFGMIDSPTILWAYTGGFGAMNLYISACFRGISETYAEAARIDGAGHYTIMFQIMLPLAKGIIIAMAVMQAISIWNDSQTALLFLKNMPTLATGIYLFEARASQFAMYNIMIAAVVLSTLPPLVLYIFTHKTMLESVYVGGIKG